MKHILIVLPLAGLLFAQTTHAEVGSGTLVIFQLAQGKFVVAADSRATFRDQPPKDCYCKIAALKGGFVFAVSGAPSYVPSGKRDPVRNWNSMQDSRRIVSRFLRNGKNGTPEMVEAIADAWAKEMERHWHQMYRFHPDPGVIDIAAKQKGQLTVGLFAAGVRNQIAYTMREVRLDGTRIHTVPKHPNCTGGFCGMGLGDAVIRYYHSPVDQQTSMIKWEITPPPVNVSIPETLIGIKLVHFAIADDKTGQLHGPIDCLELWPDGTVRWVLRKPDCPEQYDKRK